MITLTESRPRPHLKLGRSIAQARRRAGLSQRDLAKQVSISEGYMPNIEGGYAKPDAAILQRIAAVTAADYREFAVLAGLIAAEVGEATLAGDPDKIAILRRIATWSKAEIEALERIGRIAFSQPKPPNEQTNDERAEDGDEHQSIPDGKGPP